WHDTPPRVDSLEGVGSPDVWLVGPVFSYGIRDSRDPFDQSRTKTCY
ncbi:hypothetical protein A2U01_0045241, partial [Trifolium medium]|nr:hypothetical protein [Trifolium medium]